MAIIGAILWVVLAYLVAVEAKKKKRDFLFWLLLALFTSPLIAFIILLIAGRK